jgi:hypothetical protein
VLRWEGNKICYFNLIIIICWYLCEIFMRFSIRQWLSHTVYHREIFCISWLRLNIKTNIHLLIIMSKLLVQEKAAIKPYNRLCKININLKSVHIRPLPLQRKKCCNGKWVSELMGFNPCFAPKGLSSFFWGHSICRGDVDGGENGNIWCKRFQFSYSSIYDFISIHSNINGDFKTYH